MYKTEDTETLGENVLKFAPKTANKEPPGGDWLSSLKEGTIFLCGLVNAPELQEFHIIRNINTAVKLYSNINQEAYLWVRPKEFCKLYKLHEILQEGNE